MTHYYYCCNQTNRGVLSFPAVFPSETISPTTLLTSLITLSHDICNHQSKFFPTQKRNSKETMRQVSILLIFLHEIRDSNLILPHSILLPFSELHFAFQKIHLLIQDCTREAAKLFMLMKSQYVATQFQALIRDVATLLDVLPLHSIGICDEVTELVELVTKQSWKVKFELDPNDEGAKNRVNSVLRQFERGIEPDLNVFQQILDYLEIKSWNDCNKEIKFLEDEISFEYSKSDERGVPMLSSLLGFLNYCRVVKFEALEFNFKLDNGIGDQSEARCSREMIRFVNLEDFRCPISLELMTDPVTVSTGQTYDRASIKKWLKAGNLTCPKTGEKLTNTELVPNMALKNLIQNFCAENGISLTKWCNRSRDITTTNVPGSPAAAHAMQFLSWFLTRRLVSGTEEQKNKAAYEVRLLAKSNIFNRACLIEVGTVPPLLDLLASNDKSTQENAIGALLKLSKRTPGQAQIMENGGLKPILIVLKRGLSLEARQIAAATIFYLSSVKEYRKRIGENSDAIPSLVELLKERKACGRKNAVAAIFALVLYAKNHQRVLEAGAVPVLIGISASSSDKSELVTECLAVLAALAENVDGAKAILQASGLPLITGILKSETCRAGKEHTASILLSLCVNVGAEAVGILAKDSSLMPLLYSLVCDGSSQAAKKARFLIKVLLDFNETRSSRLKGTSVEQEQVLSVL